MYDLFSDSIANNIFNQDVINNKRTPQAHCIIITHNHTDDGWKILLILLSKRCPFLGGKLFDVATEITMLKINQNNTIHTFYQRVQDLQTKLPYSKETVNKIHQLKLYLKAMAASKDHFHLLQHFISDLNLHINKYGANTKHSTHTCGSIYNYLVSTDAPERFNLKSDFTHSGLKHNKKAFQNHTSPSPNTSALEQVEDLLYTTSFDEQGVTFQPPQLSPQDDDIHPPCTPIIAAFQQSSNIIFDTCGFKGHHASKCFKRGIEFLPRDVQRQIATYNAKYGSSPTSDSSPSQHKSFHSLPPPDHWPSSSTSTAPTIRQNDVLHQQAPTISSLTHNLPSEDIEEILDLELGKKSKHTINTLNNTNLPDIPHPHEQYYLRH